jgi:type II secretory pathway component GspD/PulD (secretin)
MKYVSGVLAATLAMTLCGSAARGQTPLPPPSQQNPYPVQTFYVSNVTQVEDFNEIVTAVRNLLVPTAKVYPVWSQHTLFVQASPDEILLVQKMLADLDRVQRTYRLTYTITEIDGGKRVGTQHYAMVVVSGQRTTLKQGSKVPVITGTTSAAGSGMESHFTYLDVGISLDASLEESATGVKLSTKAEQSSVSEVRPVAQVQDPVVRQTVLMGVAILTPGKPVVLGSLDIPDSTRRMDLEVVMEVVK